MRYLSRFIIIVSFVTLKSISAPQDLKESDIPVTSIGNQLFIFQGAYDSLGTVDEIAMLAARHDYVVLTHGFYLDGSKWVNGKCLDVNYSKMLELLVTLRKNNPDVKIFVYVSATADHPNGCWPQPSITMADCPNGNCQDFKTWTNLWLDLEKQNDSIVIDGIFIDLVHPALIGASVRDSVFSYVKSKGKLIMANALSDTIGLSFAVASPMLTHDDFVLIEGYYWIAGWPNTQTEGMNTILDRSRVRWAAIVSEYYNTDLSCNSENRILAYKMFLEHGGSAFAYQSSDIGTQSGKWVYCRNEITAIPVENVDRDIPVQFILEQNYPNPFNPITTIKYFVAKPSVVKIKVYNILGQNVRTLVNEFQTVGDNEVIFDAGDLPSGLYYYSMEAGVSTYVKNMVLIK